MGVKPFPTKRVSLVMSKDIGLHPGISDWHTSIEVTFSADKSISRSMLFFMSATRRVYSVRN